MKNKTRIQKNLSISLVNPWSGSTNEMKTWKEIKAWAHSNVNGRNLRDWIKTAREAYNDHDGDTLGKMIIGS